MLFASCGLATLHWNAGYAARNRGRRRRAVHRHRPRLQSQFPRRHVVHAGRAGWRVSRWRSACPGSPSSTSSAPASGTSSAGSRRGAASRATSPSASKPRRRASKRPRSKRNASPRASSRASKRRRPWSRRASASRRNGRCRCSMRRSRGELPPLKLLDDPPVHEASAIRRKRSRPCRAWSSSSSRISASKSKWWPCSPGPWSRAYEMRPAPGVKVSQISRSRQGSRAFALGDQRARGRSHPRQIGHGSRDPEREARDRHARRDHQVEGVRRRDVAARDRARQGHRRRAGVRGSRQDAAPAHRGHHRLGQVGRHQRHDPVAALQEHRRARAPDHDRSRRCSSSRCTRAFRICSRPWSRT